PADRDRGNPAIEISRNLDIHAPPAVVDASTKGDGSAAGRRRATNRARRSHRGSTYLGMASPHPFAADALPDLAGRAPAHDPAARTGAHSARGLAVSDPGPTHLCCLLVS